MQAKVCGSKETGVRTVSTAEALELAGRGEELVWLDIAGPLTPEDRELLGKPPFNFHELALEDASKQDGQRSKVEPYDDHFFLVMHEVSASVSTGSLALEWEEIDIFVGGNFLVSVHRGDSRAVERVWKDADTRSRIMSCGSGMLAYYLLDTVVDGYIETIDGVEDELDTLEDAVVDPRADESTVHRIFDFKRELIHFRKKAGPLREAINEMTSRDFPLVTSDMLPYLRDVYDHLIRLSDMLDSYRDILTGSLDVHLSAVSNRLNEIMKRLTLVATIFMPLTFITGFWGMNFAELPVGSRVWMWGSLLFMAVVSAVMIIIFKTRKYR
ncbi:MAG: magnesium/cobalt transporter CorA [Thermoleophilia bacterium]|nr:magnesium/cobalt transporter CorA [Thermoleophilia bacterium]